MRLPEKGHYQISGLAWSGHGRIADVRVSTDGGESWTSAELQEPVLPQSLVRFRLGWEWDGQPAVIQSLAIDDSGLAQPSRSEWKAR